MKGKFMRSWARRKRLLGFLAAGFIFSLALFQTNPASANWARALNDSELDTVFAGDSIKFNWSTRIRFADYSGRFKFDFSASGSFTAQQGSHHDGGGFNVETVLLGGLFKIEASGGDNSGHGSSSSGSSGSSSHHIPGPIVVTVGSSGDTTDTDGIGNSFGGGNFVSLTVSREGEDGDSGGGVTITFGGSPSNTGNSIVSFNGINVDSKVAIDIALIRSSISAHGSGGGGGLVSNIVHRSMCLGCP